MDNIIYSTETNRYSLYEKAAHSKYERRCIDGTTVGCSKCCGYCQYEEHPGFLTEKQMKEHSCLQKQCYHFIPKPARAAKHEKQTPSKLFDFVKKKVSDMDGIKVMRIKNTDEDCVAYFVTITNEYDFDDCIFEAKHKYDVSLSFVKLNYDFDVCAQIICAG